MLSHKVVGLVWVRGGGSWDGVIRGLATADLMWQMTGEQRWWRLVIRVHENGERCVLCSVFDNAVERLECTGLHPL